uniref:U5-Theriditoxin-Lha1a_1 n=1 Tax=Latrodectus hasselti TaxID=256736 RepID=A0A482ZE94_LATHA
MKYTCLFCSILIVWIVPLQVASMQDVYYRVINKEDVNMDTTCEEMQVTLWKIGFHDCFVTRKINDGGRDLESIVDRILGHAEACVETSSRSCVPDFEGFKRILTEVIKEMKDYTNMYLEEIIKGREK